MDRLVYEYTDWDGVKLFADPTEVLRLIKEKTEGTFSSLVAAMKNFQGDPGKGSESIEKLKEATIYAFGLKPFDRTTGQGWLEPDLIGLISGFNEFINRLKKNTAASPIGSMSTAG